MPNHTVYTVGHSTRPIDNFVSLLKSFEIEIVIDVRTIARSRHNPQYNETVLDKRLRQDNISYLRISDLGGLRHTTNTSINKGWHNLSFRGYADYMQTLDFHEGLRQLIEISKVTRTVIMCAEAVPWRCHRSLIGDALLIRDMTVEDIMNEGTSTAHRLTSFAAVKGESITYPAALD